MPFFMLHPRELEQVRKKKEAFLVDLREREHYLKYNYKGAANLPYREGERWLEHFKREKTYILYCDYGNTSLLVARKLSQRGITAYSVIGGINAIRHFQQQKDRNPDFF